MCLEVQKHRCSGLLFVALAPDLPELLADVFHKPKKAGWVTSYDHNYRSKLWNSWKGSKSVRR